jgi:hypothetical protein
MHPHEWRAARRVRARYIAAFEKAYIPIELPVLEMLHEFLCARIQTQRFERTLLEPIPNDASLPLPAITPAHLEALQKNQEKLRKLRTELTSLLPKPVPTPPDPYTLWVKQLQEADQQREQEAAAAPAPQVQVFDDPIPDYDYDPLEEYYHPTKPTTGPREHPADKLEREWKEKGVIRLATPQEVAEMDKAQEDSEREAAEWEAKRNPQQEAPTGERSATALQDHLAPDPISALGRWPLTITRIDNSC